MHAREVKQSYSRAEVRRMLSLTERRLRGWEKQGLVPVEQAYSFAGIKALRTLQGLLQAGVPARRVRSAFEALRAKCELQNPLAEVKVFADKGRRLRVQVGGQQMEPVSGQLLLDFGSREFSRLLELPRGSEPRRSQTDRRAESDRWFQRGLDLEQAGAPVREVIAAYEQAVAAHSGAAGALVNLGTIYFHERNWDMAECYYRRAIQADPHYALPHFNLGNLFDERGDRTRALTHYEDALKLDPNYSDAHYNLALLYQTLGHRMKALRHWKAYLKLDPSSSWAAVARREMEKLRRLVVHDGVTPFAQAAGDASGDGPKASR